MADFADLVEVEGEEFTGLRIQIADLSDPLVPFGQFQVTVILKDGFASVTKIMYVEILAVQEAVIEEKEEIPEPVKEEIVIEPEVV